MLLIHWANNNSIINVVTHIGLAKFYSFSVTNMWSLLSVMLVSSVETTLVTDDVTVVDEGSETSTNNDIFIQ